MDDITLALIIVVFFIVCILIAVWGVLWSETNKRKIVYVECTNQGGAKRKMKNRKGGKCWKEKEIVLPHTLIKESSSQSSAINRFTLIMTIQYVLYIVLYNVKKNKKHKTKSYLLYSYYIFY